MRSRLGVVAVAALVVLAGCTGVNPLGDSGPAGDPSDTDNGNLSLVDEDAVTTTDGDDTAATTTAGSSGETDSSGAGNGTTPPGMAANGSVENISALFVAHIAELQSLSSYRVVIDREQRNGAVRGDLAVDNTAKTYRGEESGGRLYYVNGTQYRLQGEATGVEGTDTEFSRIHEAGTELVDILDALNLTAVNRTTAGETTVVRYRVTGFDRDLITEIQNLTGYVRITTDGLVCEVDLDATTPSGESLPQRYAIEDINDTAVEAPEWFEDFQENRDTTAPQLTVSFDFREESVSITHQGGESASSLTVRYTAGGESVVETWEPEDGIAAGVSYTTERAPDPGTVVRVVWSEDDQSVTLAQHEVPEE